MKTTKMPTPAEFRRAEAKMVAAGWVKVCTVMVDDAHRPTVTEFGILFNRGAGRFFLNHKTIGDLPPDRKPHDAGRESDLPEWLRP
jgi:hypothetical protein